MVGFCGRNKVGSVKVGWEGKRRECVCIGSSAVIVDEATVVIHFDNIFSANVFRFTSSTSSCSNAESGFAAVPTTEDVTGSPVADAVEFVTLVKFYLWLRDCDCYIRGVLMFLWKDTRV